jgi:hypothetical protein
MADNVKIAEPGTGTTIASDDVGGVHYQVCKIAYGALDSVTLVTTSAGFPVQQQGVWTVADTTADGANVTLGAKADAKSTATDTTAVSAMSVLKQISASVQAPPSQAVTNAGTFAVQATLAAGSANIGDVDVLSLPALPAGTNAIGTVDLKANVGRTAINLYATNAAAGATTVETAITLTKSAGTGATSTGTSFVVTSGKKFRITAITFAARGHATATIQATTFSLRMNTGGAVTTTSTPVLIQARVATPATASAWDRLSVPIPDGLEIAGDGTLQIGVTAVAVFTTNAPTWDVWITGYEY